MRHGPQLLTYPDSLGGDLASLRGLLDGPLAGLFGGVHVLPPFPSSGDRGFAPLTYREIDPRFGTWADIRALAADHDVLLDLMVNHISRQSEEFRDFERHGRRVAVGRPVHHARQGLARRPRRPTSDVARIFLRKPDDPFSTITVARHRRAGDRLDHVRDGRLVRAGRPRPRLAGDPAPHRPTGSRSSPRRACASSVSMPSATSSRRPAPAASWSSPRSGR